MKGIVNVGSMVIGNGILHGPVPIVPHPFTGTVITGNPQILIEKKPVACIGDSSVHSCGSMGVIIGTGFTILSGKKPTALLGDMVIEPIGIGTIVTCSFKVFAK